MVAIIWKVKDTESLNIKAMNLHLTKFLKDLGGEFCRILLLSMIVIVIDF